MTEKEAIFTHEEIQRLIGIVNCNIMVLTRSGDYPEQDKDDLILKKLLTKDFYHRKQLQRKQ